MPKTPRQRRQVRGMAVYRNTEYQGSCMFRGGWIVEFWQTGRTGVRKSLGYKDWFRTKRCAIERAREVAANERVTLVVK